MGNIFSFDNDFLWVGVIATTYFHIVWGVWELLVYLEDKYPLTGIPVKVRDFTLGFLSTFWPLTLLLFMLQVIMDSIIKLFKKLWKT